MAYNSLFLVAAMKFFIYTITQDHIIVFLFMNIKLKQSEIMQTCCPVHVTWPEMEPIDAAQADELEDLFKILANDTRLRLLHNLARVEEMCVCDLATAVGMTPQAISNQLQRLYGRGIVSTRRSGNMIYYRVVDQCVVELLQKAICLLTGSQKQ